MATTTYFSEPIEDRYVREPVELEVGTSSFWGEGPELYITVGDQTLTLDHEAAARFCEAVETIARYFGYQQGTRRP